MSLKPVIRLVLVLCALSACDKQNKTVDRGFDSKPLAELKAGIWVDPNGCDHWIIDDGVEGYLSQRLDPEGKPVCSGIAPPNTATGPFRAGTYVVDAI